MIRFISYILVLSFLIACNSNTILKKPENLIPKDKMVKILTDSYIARGAEGVNNINKDRRVNYLSLIYKRHNVDSVTFNQSLKYYTADISLNEEILKLVQQSIDDKLENLKSAKDSIHLVKVDSLETTHQKIIDDNIANLKQEQEEKLNLKIDSIKKVQDDTFNKQITNLENKLKDSLNFSSNKDKAAYIDDIQKQIADINKAKKDSIDINIKKVKTDYQKIIDKETEAIKKKEENFIAKKKKEFERKKYQ